MGFSRSAPLTGGGTIYGNLTIDGDCSVTGSTAITTNEVIQGTSIIDVTNAEAFLVRKDSDGGDIFTVDTTNSQVELGSAVKLVVKRDSYSGTLSMTSANGYLELQALGDRSVDIKSQRQIRMYTSADGASYIQALNLSATDGNATFLGTVTVGADGSGKDVTFYSDTAGDSFVWDSSAEKLTITGTNGQTALDIADGNLVVADSVDIEGDIDVNGTSNLDDVDIDGDVDISGSITNATWTGDVIASAYLDSDTAHLSGTQTFTGAKTFTDAVTIGADGSGHDVTFHSGTAGDSFVWDSSEEKLTITGTNGQTALDVADGNLVVADNVDIEGDIDVNGTSNFDDVDIDGDVDISGSITNAAWTGDVIASAYLDGDTAHLSGTQTFSGNKTFSAETKIANSGQGTLIIGSTDASGAALMLDGDSNGDAAGADYSYIHHDTAGILNIVQDSPSGTNEIRFGTAGTEDKITIDASGNLIVGSAAGSGADVTFYTAGTAAHVGLKWDADLNTEGTLVGGADDHGVDFKFFGETAGKYIQWDQSADELVLAGAGTKISLYDAAGGESISADASGVLSIAAGAEIDLTTTTIDINGAVDISGNSQFSGTITVGVDDTGKDVKLFGATAGSYMLWDESDDQLEFVNSNIELGGNHILNNQGKQAHVANTMSAPYYRFDGTNDEVAIADSAILSFFDNIGDVEMSVCAWINMFDATSFPIVNKGTYNSDAEWNFGVGSDDKLYLTLYDESVASTHETAKADVALTSYEGKWIHVCATYNGVGGTSAAGGILLYVNGVLQADTDSDAGTYVAMENLAEEVRIGNYDDSDYASGDISGVQVWNHTLTASEVKDLYSGGSVPYKYQSANNTHAITNGTASYFDSISGSGRSSSTTAIEFTSTSWGSGALQFSSTLEKDKIYRITFTGVSGTGSGCILRFGTAMTNGTTVSAVAASGVWLSVPTGFSSIPYAFTSSSNYGGYWRARGDEVCITFKNFDNAGQTTITNLNVVEVGCIAEFDGTTVGHNQWLDKSGNDLHGIVSGATIANIPSWHREMYIDLTVTGDTSFTLPKGYRISSITTKETAGNAVGGGIDFGTTNGGGEVVAAHAISASTTADVAVAAILNNIGGTHTTADDIIYITDADGSGWDSASVEIRVSMERVSMY